MMKKTSPRPGRWINGLGWVAPDTAMQPGDEFRLFGVIAPMTMSAETVARIKERDAAPVVATRWADDTVPTGETHASDEDITALVKLAAEYAREGDWKTSQILRRAFDDLRGSPITPKGMHTN